MFPFVCVARAYYCSRSLNFCSLDKMSIRANWPGVPCNGDIIITNVNRSRGNYSMPWIEQNYCLLLERMSARQLHPYCKLLNYSFASSFVICGKATRGMSPLLWLLMEICINTSLVNNENERKLRVQRDVIASNGGWFDNKAIKKRLHWKKWHR